MNPKKLIEMAIKWQKVASLAKRASSPKKDDACSISVAEKGHFVVYTTDSKRFIIPLVYLESTIFVELLKMSEDELGLTSDGPIVLPCDAMFMEYVLSLLKRRGTKSMDRVLLGSVLKHRRSPCSSHFVGFSQQAVCSF